MSEERPCPQCHYCGFVCKPCPICGVPCCDNCGDSCDCQKNFHPHWKKNFDFFKKDDECNLCNFVNVSDEVTLGVLGGFTICGCVTDIDCKLNTIKLATGAQIKGPELDHPICTDRVITICCESIVWVF